MQIGKPKMYLGLDLSGGYAMLSSFTDGMKEPETLSRINGSEFYEIPMALFKKKGVGQWYYGEDAYTKKEKEEGTFFVDLWNKALNQEFQEVEEELFSAVDLFALFIRKVLMLPKQLGTDYAIGKLVITTWEVTEPVIALLAEVMKKNGIMQDQYILQSHKESFYYYALSQESTLWLHDVALFDYTDGVMRHFLLSRNEKTKPETVFIEEVEDGVLFEDKDEAFSGIIEQAFAHRILSTSYLTGNDFQEEWLKESLKVLCRGKKAFLGKNLFSKGACYGALVKAGLQSWNFVFMGENQLKVNVSLKVKEKGEVAFYSLLSAGECWFDEEGSLDIILDGTPEIDFWIQEPYSRDARIQTLSLTDFPDRENKTSRLRITAKPVSDVEILVQIKDLGFGEFVKTSEKVWEYMLR